MVELCQIFAYLCWNRCHMFSLWKADQGGLPERGVACTIPIDHIWMWSSWLPLPWLEKQLVSVPKDAAVAEKFEWARHGAVQGKTKHKTATNLWSKIHGSETVYTGKRAAPGKYIHIHWVPLRSSKHHALVRSICTTGGTRGVVAPAKILAAAWQQLGPSCPSRPWVPGFLTWKGTAWLQNKLLHAWRQMKTSANTQKKNSNSSDGNVFWIHLIADCGCCPSSARQLDATVRGLTCAALSSYELPQLRKAFNGLNVSQNRESEPGVTPITRYDHYVKD